MKKILTKSFFNRETVLAAKELIGKHIVINHKYENLSLMVNEVEVYDGFYDKASHAHKGITKRNEVMFQEPGCWYIYLCYGMYFMLNIVTREKGYPAAILIRGAGQYNGPGKLTKFLQIDKRFNGLKACKENGLWFEDRGINIKEKEIKTSPRIGVNYAGVEWAGKHLRFFI